MSKHSPKKQKNSQRNLYAAGSIGLVLIVALAMLLTRTNTAAAKSISPADYQTQFVTGSTAHLLLDVRTPEEFATGHIHGAINIPVESLESRLGEVSNANPIVIYCRSGNRSAQAARILAEAGYINLYDMGGINAWTAQGFPVE